MVLREGAARWDRGLRPLRGRGDSALMGPWGGARPCFSSSWLPCAFFAS